MRRSRSGVGYWPGLLLAPRPPRANSVSPGYRRRSQRRGRRSACCCSSVVTVARSSATSASSSPVRATCWAVSDSPCTARRRLHGKWERRVAGEGACRRSPAAKGRHTTLPRAGRLLLSTSAGAERYGGGRPSTQPPHKLRLALDCAREPAAPGLGVIRLDRAALSLFAQLCAGSRRGAVQPPSGSTAQRSLDRCRLPAPEPASAGCLLQRHDLRSEFEHFALKLVGKLSFALTEALGVLRNRLLLA